MPLEINEIVTIDNICYNFSCFVIANDKICYLNKVAELKNELRVCDFDKTVLYQKEFRGDGAYTLYYINTSNSLLILFSDLSVELFDLNIMEFKVLSVLEDYQMLSRFNESKFFITEKSDTYNSDKNYGVYEVFLDEILFIERNFKPYFFQNKQLFGGRTVNDKLLIRHDDNTGAVLWEFDVDSLVESGMKSKEVDIHGESIGEFNDVVFFRCHPFFIIGLDIITGKLVLKINLKKVFNDFISFQYSRVMILLDEESGVLYFFFNDHYSIMDIKSQTFINQKKYYPNPNKDVKVVTAHVMKNNYMIGTTEGERRHEKSLITLDLLSNELVQVKEVKEDVLDLRFFGSYLTVMNDNLEAHVFALNFDC